MHPSHGPYSIKRRDVNVASDGFFKKLVRDGPIFTTSVNGTMETVTGDCVLAPWNRISKKDWVAVFNVDKRDPAMDPVLSNARETSKLP